MSGFWSGLKAKASRSRYTKPICHSIKSTDGGPVVTVTPDYTLKYGPVGWLMDRIMVRQLFNGGMEDLLSGLKYYVETGRIIGERVPGMAAAVV